MSASVALWGKLPGFGDFLRLGSRSAPLSAIDTAFTELRLDTARAAAFSASAPVVAFFHQADRWWGSVVLPSTDRVGRPAPLVAMAGLRAVDPADEIGVLPLAFGSFIGRVLAQHAAGWPTEQDAVLAAVAAAAADLDLGAAEETFVATLEASPQETLWALTGGAAGCHRTLSIVAAAAAGRLPVVGMRIAPIGSPVNAGFWLSAAWLVRGRDDPPGPIVLHPGAAGIAPSVALLWPSPTGAALAAILWPAAVLPAYFPALATPQLEGVLPREVRLPADLCADGKSHLRDLLYRLVTERRTHRYTRTF